MFLSPIYLSSPQFDIASKKITPDIYQFDERIGNKYYYYGEGYIAVRSDVSDTIFFLDSSLDLIWKRDLQDIALKIGIPKINQIIVLNVDKDGVWLENHNRDQKFHHIYQISKDQINIFELDTFNIGNLSSFYKIDTRIIKSKNRIIAFVDAIFTNFISFTESELDNYHFAAYILGNNKVEQIFSRENAVEYLDMRDIMYDRNTPIIIFRHKRADDIIYNIYRFEKHNLVKDVGLENTFSTIKNNLQANRLGGYYRRDALVTIWEKFYEVDSDHFVLYLFADDKYFSTINLTNYFGEGHVGNSLLYLGLPQTIDLGYTNNMIMSNLINNYLISIDGYEVRIESVEYNIDGSFTAFGMGKLDRNIVYWGVLAENGEYGDINEVLISYKVDSINLAAKFALINPLELYGFPSLVYTLFISLLYIYKKRHIQMECDTYPQMQKENKSN